MIENLIKKKKGESAIVTLTKKRIKLNLNMFCMFTGKLGAGKTWSGISYAQELDSEFDVDKQIVFDFRSCMNLINAEWFRNKKIKIILWDEPQISISNRAWQSQINKLVNYLISTFRHQNIILIMCAPYKDFLDVQTMKLLQWEFQCSRIERKNNQCIVYLKYQQYNPQKKKTYPHALFIIDNNHREVKINTWAIEKPTKDAIKIYEDNKTKFTHQLNKSIQDTLDKLEATKQLGINEADIKLPEPYEETVKLFNELEESNPETSIADINKKAAEITGLDLRTIQNHRRKYKIKKFLEKKIRENDVNGTNATADPPINHSKGG